MVGNYRIKDQEERSINAAHRTSVFYRTFKKISGLAVRKQWTRSEGGIVLSHVTSTKQRAHVLKDILLTRNSSLPPLHPILYPSTCVFLRCVTLSSCFTALTGI